MGFEIGKSSSLLSGLGFQEMLWPGPNLTKPLLMNTVSGIEFGCTGLHGLKFAQSL